MYGLACAPDREDAVRALADAKGRAPDQPIALLARDVDVVLELVPELMGHFEAVARALLPGPYTLVLPNPARRLPRLGGDTIGIRVPQLPAIAAAVLDEVGAVAATSANRHHEPDPRSLADVSSVVLAAAAATLDAGELPGTPSTVVDLTGEAPRVLRVGAVHEHEALARVAAALGE